MKKRIILYADEGKILTNGKTYRRRVCLADTVSPDDYYEITKEEYEEIKASLEAKIDDETAIAEATE